MNFRKLEKSMLKVLLIELLLLITIPTSIKATTLSVDDLFNLSIEELTQVKIESATKRSESITDIPATVYVIGNSELLQYGFYDLKQVLLFTPGVEYAYPHSWLQGGQRGVVGNWSKTKLLINGIDLNLLYTGEAFIGNQFSLDNIKQIEVIQGPGSVIYGSDAFSGVINLVTREPNSRGRNFSISNTTGIGSDGLQHYHVGAILSAMYDKFDYTLSAGLTKLNDVDFTDFVKTTDFSRVNISERKYFLESGQEPYVDKNLAYNIHLGINYKFTPKSKLKLDYLNLYDKDNGGQEYAEVSFKHFESIRHQNALSVKYDYFFNDIHSINLRTQFRHDQELNDWIYGTTVDGNISPVFSWDVDGSQSKLAELYWNIHPKKYINHTIVGAGFREENLAEIFYEEATFEHLNKFLNPQNYFFFFQTQQKLFKDKIYTTIGLRKDQNSIYDAPLTIRAGLTYKIVNDFKVKYFYSEAFKAPTLFDLELNDDLNPEYNQTHEIVLGTTFSNNFYLQTATFFSHAYDLIVSVKDPSVADEENIFISLNAETMDYKGNETILKYKGSSFNFDLWLNYTNTNELQKIRPFKTGLKTAYKLGPRSSLGLLARYGAKVETDYLDENYNIHFEKLPAFFTTDVIYNLNELNITSSYKADVTLSIQNIFNYKNHYPNLRGNDPKQFKEQGTSFWCQLKLKI